MKYGISISQPPAKTKYKSGDALDLSGMVVTARYSNGSTVDVTWLASANPHAGTVLNEAGNLIITITYNEDGITRTATFDVSVESGITSVEGRIIWDDDDNADGTRPFEITVTLYRDGVQHSEQTVRPFTVLGEWAYSFDNLLRFDPAAYDLREFEYTVGAEAGGYKFEIAQDGRTITLKLIADENKDPDVDDEPEEDPEEDPEENPGDDPEENPENQDPNENDGSSRDTDGQQSGAGSNESNESGMTGSGDWVPAGSGASSEQQQASSTAAAASAAALSSATAAVIAAAEQRAASAPTVTLVPTGQPNEYIVLDDSGDPLGTVTLPEDVTPEMVNDRKDLIDLLNEITPLDKVNPPTGDIDILNYVLALAAMIGALSALIASRKLRRRKVPGASA